MNTRGNACLDNILTNVVELSSDVFDLGFSDHLAVTVQFNLPSWPKDDLGDHVCRPITERGLINFRAL